MFGSSTESSPRSNHPSSDTCLPAAEFDSFDIQYEICSKFIKMASQQLYQKELQLISSTSTFIEKVQDSIAAKDFSCMHQTLSTFDTFCDDDDAISQPSRSRLLLRKSGSNGSLRRTESGLNDALREVQKRCSEKTSSMLSNLAGEFKRMKQKLASSQKFEKELKRLQLRFNSSEEELLLARKRVSDLEKENKSQSEQVHSLRKRLKQATEQVKTASLILSKSSDNLKPLFTPGPTDKMRRYLEQKEVHIFKKQKQIRLIQDRIQSSMQASMENGCQKCCQMMKRIKESIMKYRVFLQEQADAAEQCYNNFKRHFY